MFNAIFNFVTSLLESFALWLAGREREPEWGDAFENPEWDSWTYRWYVTSREVEERWADETHPDLFWSTQFDAPEVPPMPRLLLAYRTVMEIGRGWFLSTFHPLLADYCEKFGHGAMDDHGWAGPESGGESMTCRRCGYHWSHIYY